MIYRFSFSRPQSRYIRIEATAENVRQPVLSFQLPSWRPGRYELGNFAKNVRGFTARDQDGRELKSEKITKDLWNIQSKGATSVTFSYEYYAAELNAGSTFLDESQLYVNPVNCCGYIPERIGEDCTAQLSLPPGWKVASSLQKKGADTLYALNFDRFADSPFIAGPSLKHNVFVLDGVEFHLWFQGECQPEWPKLISDFFIFINEQMVIFGSFPSTEYHFLFQVLPNRFYHGVEHRDCTVIALGPSYKLMNEVYGDLLGVSCHELFHAWNIKSIRPAEMYPYDLTKENYSRLGYVCEGVTTYYGDYLLFRSGVWNEEEYWPTFIERMEKHFESHARYFLSVADSSFDTWLDGYVPGAPHRKTSIYHEGCLLAFVTDIFIRRHSKNAKSLDNVMRRLWNEFACKDKGYTGADYKKLVEEEAGADFSYYWNNYFYKGNSYEPVLSEALAYIGYELTFEPSKRVHERDYGFKVAEPGGLTKVTEVYYGSPAEKCGLAPGDEVLAVNGMQLKADMAEWLKYFGGEEAELIVASSGRVKTVVLRTDGKHYYDRPGVKRKADADGPARESFSAWSGKKF